MSKDKTEQIQGMAERIAAIVSQASETAPDEKDSKNREAILKIRDILLEFDEDIIKRNMS